MTGSVIEATTWKGEEGAGVLNMKKKKKKNVIVAWDVAARKGRVILEGVE